MTEYAYRLLNVFTRDGGRLTGNPLCVFERGEGLNDAAMQALARQFNLSETTFLLPATAPDAHVRVRIFTPSYEMPFAGHPTLGSAAVCRALGHTEAPLRLQLPVGIVSVTLAGARCTLTAPAYRARRPALSTSQLAQALGLMADDIAGAALWINSGSEQLMVPLASVTAVERARPAAQLPAELVDAKIYVFAHTGADSLRARFFFPQDGAYWEDPATGSAAVNLGGWWLASERERPAQLTIEQGEQVLRPSTLHLQIAADASVRVGGDVIELGRGSVQL